MKPSTSQLVVALAIVTVVGASVTAQNARPSQEPDVMTALLTEVRALRVAMEQMVSSGPRVQLALGRLQLQEQRINSIIRRLESVRDGLSSAQKEVGAAQAQIEMVAKMSKDAAAGGEDPGPIGQIVAGFEQGAAAARAEVQRLQNEEAVLQQQLAEEQGRWVDINRSLEQLERALARP